MINYKIGINNFWIWVCAVAGILISVVSLLKEPWVDWSSALLTLIFVLIFRFYGIRNKYENKLKEVLTINEKTADIMFQKFMDLEKLIGNNTFDVSFQLIVNEVVLPLSVLVGLLRKIHLEKGYYTRVYLYLEYFKKIQEYSDKKYLALLAKDEIFHESADAEMAMEKGLSLVKIYGPSVASEGLLTILKECGYEDSARKYMGKSEWGRFLEKAKNEVKDYGDDSVRRIEEFNDIIHEVLNSEVKE